MKPEASYLETQCHDLARYWGLGTPYLGLSE